MTPGMFSVDWTLTQPDGGDTFQGTATMAFSDKIKTDDGFVNPVLRDLLQAIGDYVMADVRVMVRVAEVEEGIKG